MDPGGVDAGAGGPGSTTGCDVSDPSLRLCLTFDQTPMRVVDLVNPAMHMLADASGVSQILRLSSGSAQFGPASRIRFAEPPRCKPTRRS